MHEIHKCTHLDFNKSYGCTCSTDTDNLNKIGYRVNVEGGYTIPAEKSAGE